jgi:hypothetical protein
VRVFLFCVGPTSVEVVRDLVAEVIDDLGQEAMIGVDTDRNWLTLVYFTDVPALVTDAEATETDHPLTEEEMTLEPRT